MNEIKVLHICAGNLYGGIERLLISLAQTQSLCKNLKPQFACCFTGKLMTELMETGLPVHMLGNVKLSQPWTTLKARKQLKNLLKREQFDLIACHSPWSYVVFEKVARRLGIPVVIWLHAASSGKHWLERWAALHRPDLVICVSRAILDETAQIMFPDINKVLLHNPLTSAVPALTNSDIERIRRDLNTPSGAIVIIQVSRMEPLKGQIDLLNVLGRIKELPDWICWQVGGPQRESEEYYFQSLKAQAQQLGINARIRFLGERSDVPHLLQAADIYCQPNRAPEGFGLVFVEALAAGRPVITTAFGGALEIIDNSCGILTKPHDASSLKTALIQLINDIALRQSLGENGKAKVLDKFSSQALLLTQYQIFQQLIK